MNENQMCPNIPTVVEELYHYYVSEPNPYIWPDYVRCDPVKAHGLWAFYCGLQLGVRFLDAAMDKK